MINYSWALPRNNFSSALKDRRAVALATPRKK